MENAYVNVKKYKYWKKTSKVKGMCVLKIGYLIFIFATNLLNLHRR